METFDFQVIIDLIKELGIGQGLLIIVAVAIIGFLVKHYHKMQKETIVAKENEIKRLAAENKEYRRIFLSLLAKSKDLDIDPDYLILKDPPEEKTMP